MSVDTELQADLARYPQRPWLKEPSSMAVWVYRFGRRTDRRPPGLRKRLLGKLYWPLFHFTEILLGIGLSKSVVVGAGLRIFHFGNIFIHPKVVIGERCTLRQGVTIGNRHSGDDVPVIGDDVEFGAYAQVLGAVRIGNNCRIGAMSVVLCDVPDGATAVGIPARIVMPREPKAAAS